MPALANSGLTHPRERFKSTTHKGDVVPFLFSFSPVSLTETAYNELTNRLAGIGAGAPAGRWCHICYRFGEGLRVGEVWNTLEDYNRFHPDLIAIADELGIDMGKPKIAETFRIVDTVAEPAAD
jgi:hypothetical protein